MVHVLLKLSVQNIFQTISTQNTSCVCHLIISQEVDVGTRINIESSAVQSTCSLEHVHTRVEDISPKAPTRRKSPKTTNVHQACPLSKPEPKIGFSYANDPHNTPTIRITADQSTEIPHCKIKITPTPDEPQAGAISTVSLKYSLIQIILTHCSTISLN